MSNPKPLPAYVVQQLTIFTNTALDKGIVFNNRLGVAKRLALALATGRYVGNNIRPKQVLDAIGAPIVPFLEALLEGEVQGDLQTLQIGALRALGMLGGDALDALPTILEECFNPRNSPTYVKVAAIKTLKAMHNVSYNQSFKIIAVLLRVATQDYDGVVRDTANRVLREMAKDKLEDMPQEAKAQLANAITTLNRHNAVLCHHAFVTDGGEWE